MKKLDEHAGKVQSQYDMVKGRIEEEEMFSSVVIDGFELEDEVARMLIDEGFDVIVFLMDNPLFSYNIIDWGKSQEGKKGEFTLYDYTKNKKAEENILDFVERLIRQLATGEGEYILKPIGALIEVSQESSM